MIDSRRAIWVWMALALAAGEAGAARRVRVESLNGERVHDAIDTRDGVRLVRQLSRADCRFGDTWGYDRDGIWVDKGCRAEFEVGRSTSSTSGSIGSPGATGGKVVRVESRDGAYTYKRTDTHGGVQLERELSRSACHMNDSWGFDSNGIWADKGCRAEFRVGGPAPAGGTAGAGPGCARCASSPRTGRHHISSQ